MRLTIYLILFLLVLATPAALRFHASAAPQSMAAQRLVILTVNNQDIRREFAQAFDRWHREKFGTGVLIDYRTTGGTNDMQRLFTNSLAEWVKNGQISPNAPVDYDLVWGGGDYAFGKFTALQIGDCTVSVLQPIPLAPDFLAAAFPSPRLAGYKLYDSSTGPDGKPAAKWIGTCLSSFGIAYNPDVYSTLGLTAPATWTDIADPRLAGMVALADPTHSGSAAVAYLMVQQRAMADAEQALFATRPDLKTLDPATRAKDPAYKAAIDAGWKIGMARLVLIAANARYFTDGAPQVVNDVGTGEAAAGLAIDFYARVEEETVSSARCRFVAPVGATAITPDPIGILYGVKGEQLALATQFVEFVLSPEGQRLWDLKVGTRGGPTERALRRAPIRQDVYADRTGWADDINPFAEAHGFNQRPEWMALFNDTVPIWGAAWIDSRSDLLSAYAAVRAVKNDDRRAALLQKLADLPISRDDLIRDKAELAAVQKSRGDEALWKANNRLKWAELFRQHYRAVEQETQKTGQVQFLIGPVPLFCAGGEMMRSFRHWLIAIFLLAFFAVFLIWPMLQSIGAGFTHPDGSFTLAYLKLIFADPSLRQGLINATGIAVGVTLCTLLLALPLAVLSVRYEFPGRGMLSALLLVPLILPPFVGAIGIRMVLGRFGTLTQLVGGGRPLGIDWLGKYKLLGIVIVEVLHLYPIMLLNLQAALANIDPAMEQAAANLGADRWTIFRRITLPLIRPGLFAGCTLVLIWSFTELGTPLMFDYYTVTPVQLFELLTDVNANPVPFALVVVTLGASAILYLVGKVFLGRGFESATTKGGVASTTQRLTGWRGIAAALPFAIVFLLAVLPHVSVILTALSATGAWYKTLLPARFTLSHFGQALTDESAFTGIRNSIQYAAVAMLIAVVVGLMAAIVIVRSDLPIRGLIDTLSMLPLAVPGLVLAFGYVAISVWFRHKLGKSTPIWLQWQEWPVPLLVIAYAARRLPYIVRSAVAGLQQTPRDLELAGMNLGASALTVLRRITFPLIFANLVAGALLAFAFSMLEVSDSLVLAQRREYYPITKAIYELSQRLGDGMYLASALGVWAMVLLALTILAANHLLGKKLGAIFRV